VALDRGLEVARGRRGAVPDRLLGDGPGKLCQALGIDRSLDGVRMRGALVEVRRGLAPAEIGVGPRIGITKAVDWPLRFVVTDKR
jgi:DNA-3-methyladenine glycosylase